MLVGLWWLFKGKGPSSESPPKTPLVLTTQSPAALVVQAPTGSSGSNNVAPVTPVVPPLVKSKDEIMQERWDAENNRPQDYYGKVIDQHGDPVSAAAVKGTLMLIRGFDVGERRQHVNTTTDADGLFEFTGLKGWQLGVVVKKEGYELDGRRGGYKAPLNGAKSTPDVTVRIGATSA